MGNTMTRQGKFLLILFITSALTGGSAWAQQKAGLVVEKVEKYSDAEKAGLREGDVLLSWSRGDSSGDFERPSDLYQVQVEQEIRGPVRLTGVRGNEKRVWVLIASDFRFQNCLTSGIEARPVLPPSLLSTYLEGKKLAKVGKLTSAVGRWRAAALEATKSSHWFSTWLFYHAARELNDAKRWKEADSLYQASIQEAAQTSPIGSVELLRARAYAFGPQHDVTDAERYFTQALMESEKLGEETLFVSASLADLGYAARYTDRNHAMELYRRALVINERLAPGSLAVADDLQNMGYLAYDLGDLAQTEDYIRKALAIQHVLAPDSFIIADNITYFGNVAYIRGDVVRAEQYYRSSMAMTRKNAPNSARGSNLLQHDLVNLAMIADTRGDLLRAEEYYQEVRRLHRRFTPNNIDTPQRIFIGLGELAMERGDLAKADDYLCRALLFAKKRDPADLAAQLVWILSDLGQVAEQSGDLAKAEKYYDQALEHEERRTHNSYVVAEMLNLLGAVVRKRGDPAKAQAYYRRSVAILDELGALASKDGADALGGLAGVMRDQQKPEDAAKLYERALHGLESQTPQLGGGEEVRSRYRAKNASHYKDYIDLLLTEKQPEQAFQVLERFHARTLLEILASAHTDIHQGIEPSLLAQERSLQQSFTAKSNRRVQLLGDKHTQEQLAALDKEINDVLGTYREVEEQIRANSPTYASLTQPQPLTAKEVQQQLLDPNTILLEYSLGEDRSHLFAVTPTSLAAYELPKRATIERLARQVYSSLTARNSRRRSETFHQWQARVTTAETEYPKLADELSQMLLGPVAPQLKGKRLLIVSDGALHYIPFAALPEPLSAAQTAVPLMVRHEIVNLPSASVLSVLRQARMKRSEPPKTKTVAVLADPVFDNNDARLRHIAAAEQSGTHGVTRGEDADAEEEDFAGRQLTRSAADVGLQEKGEVRFPRLQLTRREAHDILAVTPPGQGIEALDFNASRATALDPGLAQYRIVHFATHGLLDSQHPELSGLVLSLVNEQGKKQNGFLGLQDIYNMNLSADLVVLSACETGLGKEVEGEGLLSLTRGFMYAGAPRVVASLWKIDDLATASLMKEFYKAMEQQGERPAAALRQAQLEMWKTHRWSAAYYWAAFQIQGEWK